MVMAGEVSVQDQSQCIGVTWLTCKKQNLTNQAMRMAKAPLIFETLGHSIHG
jgi:hypothetical protein